MKRHPVYRMMLLLLLLTGWQWHVWSQPLDKGGREETTLGATRDDRPQWGDLGMENVLAVSQPTVEAPTSFRVAHDSGSPIGRHVAAGNHLFRSPAVAAATPHRPQPGYLYLLLCLRL